MRMNLLSAIACIASITLTAAGRADTFTLALTPANGSTTVYTVVNPSVNATGGSSVGYYSAQEELRHDGGFHLFA